MVQIEIKCPSCAKSGIIEVEANIISSSARGVTAVTVAEYLICEHSFFAYIDKNLSVRGVYIADFQLELPDMKLDQKLEDIVIPEVENVDVILISINIHADWLIHIIRGCFYKRKILILSDLEVLNRHLNNFFTYIFKDSFEFNILIEKRETYKSKRKDYKEYLIIDEDQVLNDTDKIMKPKMMKIEKAIVQSFLSEPDPKMSLINTKNEIQKVYQLAETIIELNNDLKEKEELSTKMIIDSFKVKYGFTVGGPYLDLLLEVIMRYFEVELAMGSGVSDFMSFL